MPVLLATLLATLLASPRALAQVPAWPGAQGGAMLAQVEVPAGALPPGPAVATAAGSDAGTPHAVRFEVEAGRASAVRLWVPYEALGVLGTERLPVEVRSESGPTWRSTIEPWAIDPSAPAAGAPWFLGTAEQLAELAVALRASGRSPEGLGLQLREGQPDCRAMTGAQLVVADAADRAEALLACVARGARVVLVVDAPPAALGDQAPGVIARWGRGLVAWAPAFDGDAAAGVGALAADSLRYEGWADTMAAQGPVPASEGSPLGAAGVLALLGLYVVVIGPVGYLVGVRPRRAALAWGWFPAVAGLATLGAALVGLAWQPEPSVEVGRAAVVAPDGTGLVQVQVRPDLAYGQGVELSAPWRDADLGGAWPSSRFGSPFGDTVGALRIGEDQVAGRLTLSGVASGSYGAPVLTWVDVVELSPPSLRGEADGYRVHNPGPRALRSGAVLVGSQQGRFAAVPAGSSALVTLEPAEPVDADYDWIDGLSSQLQGLGVAEATMIAAELEPDPAGLALAEDIELRIVDRVVVAGSAATLGGSP